MTVDDMKSLGDDSMRMDVTHDEKIDYRNSIGMIILSYCKILILLKWVFYIAPSYMSNEFIVNPALVKEYYAANAAYSVPDNVDINRQPITVGYVWFVFCFFFVVLINLLGALFAKVVELAITRGLKFL